MSIVEAIHTDVAAKRIRHLTWSGALAAGATQTLVAAVASRRIRVLALTLSTSSAANVLELWSGAAVTKILETQSNITVQAVLPFSPVGWCETAVGELLQLKDIAGSTVRVNLVYAEVG